MQHLLRNSSIPMEQLLDISLPQNGPILDFWTALSANFAATVQLVVHWPKFTIIHTHTHPFNSPLSRTTQVSRYQKGKTNLDFIEARDSEWQWHQLGRMQVCNSLQPDNHTSNPPLSFFTGRMPFLPPNQQRQSTEGRWLDVLTITQSALSYHFKSKLL